MRHFNWPSQEVELKLTCEALPTVEDVTEADIERVIGGGLFGGYAMLQGKGRLLLQVGFNDYLRLGHSTTNWGLGS